MGERKIWGRINSISVLHDFSLRCVQQVWTFIKLFYEHEVNIAAERKPEHCNTGDEEGIPSMFVCLGRRQNTPKNFLQLEIGLKILSGLGTCRMVYTPQTTCTRVWQAHQSLFADSPLLSCLERTQAPRPQPGAIASAGAHAVEGAAWGTNLQLPGEHLCPASVENRRASVQFVQY